MWYCETMDPVTGEHDIYFSRNSSELAAAIPTTEKVLNMWYELDD